MLLVEGGHRTWRHRGSFISCMALLLPIFLLPVVKDCRHLKMLMQERVTYLPLLWMAFSLQLIKLRSVGFLSEFVLAKIANKKCFELWGWGMRYFLNWKRQTTNACLTVACECLVFGLRLNGCEWSSRDLRDSCRCGPDSERGKTFINLIVCPLFWVWVLDLWSFLTWETRAGVDQTRSEGKLLLI